MPPQSAGRAAAARGGSIEQLARYGHLLARHLELEPLLDQAVDLLRQLVGADRTWLITVDGERAELRAYRGLSEADLAGWPRPVGGLAPAPLAGSATGSTGAVPVTLQVPVHRDGALVAVLFAVPPPGRPFSPDAPELAALFADYLAVAMVNAELYRSLQLRATHDPLTGLANRALASQQLELALRSGQADPVGLLFCDLDRFKVVNDLLGHEAGDDLLRQVAQRLRGAVRSGDLLARFGGDEFVLVLPGVSSLAEVAEAGARVVGALEREFTLRGAPVRATASVGGVMGVPGRSSASVLLRNADAALYVAKERGLGQVEVFDEAASHRALDRLDLRAELRHALERDQLVLYYQPIVSLADDRVVAFETLLRWYHPRHQWVPPEVLVPLAEDTGLMTAIGDWTLHQACQRLAQWRRLPGAGELAISVNLSADQLRPAGSADRLLTVIRSAGVDPAQVWLEVAQRRFGDELADEAGRLRAAGVRFVLDGFGTAYSNLRFLRTFPVEILKIDLPTVSEVTCWAEDPSLLRAILAIAGSLKLTAIGDGLRTSAEHATLRELGCELGQGELAPGSADDAVRLLCAGGLAGEATTTGRGRAAA